MADAKEARLRDVLRALRAQGRPDDEIIAIGTELRQRMEAEDARATNASIRGMESRIPAASAPTVNRPPEAPPMIGEGQDIPGGQDVAEEYQRNPALTREMAAQAAGHFAGSAVGAGVGGALASQPLGLLARLGAAGLSATAGGAAGAGTAAAVEGRPIVPAAIEGGSYTDIPGLGRVPTALVGMLMQGAGEGAGAVSRAVRGASPSIGRFARAKEAGAYQEPAMADLPGGDEGIQQAAEGGFKRVLARDAQLGREAGGRYSQAVKPYIETPTPVDRQALTQELVAQRVANINPDTGLPVKPATGNRLAKLIEETGDAPTIEGTLMRRRGLQDEAAFSSPNPTEGQQAARDAYGALRSAIRRASPEVAAADDAFAAHAKDANWRRDLFRLERDPGAASVGGEAADDLLAGKPQTIGEDIAANPSRSAQQGARMLKRAGDTNEPGLTLASSLETLANQDLEFKAALNYIKNKKALEAVRPSWKSHVPENLHGAVEHVAGLPVSLARQNARAIGAHVVDPAAAASADLLRDNAVTAPIINPIVRARQAETERQRKRAQMLGGANR